CQSTFERRKDKPMPILLVIVICLLLLVLIHSLLYFVFPRKLEKAVFPELKRPLMLAHQGGEALAPTNTLAAFALADQIGGSDVHLTSDGHLVGIHDATVDRTTNGHGRVDAHTLEELQKLDAGYFFQDAQGNYSYRGKEVRIPALEEVFSAYSEKYHLHFEIK